MLLPAILTLWDDARPAFKQARVWARARRLGLSQLACLERHTMTGLLCSCGRQFVDWSADYRVFSKDRWEPNLLFRPVLRGSLSHLPESHPVIVAVDDTLLRKRGRRTPGVAYRRDPLSPPFQVNLILAQRFIQFSILIPTASELPTAARAVPIRFEQVPLILVVDGSYTNKTVIGGLPHHTTLIGRIRKDAKLHFPHAHSPRWYGPQAPTPEELRKDEQYPCYLWRWDIEVNHRDEKQIVGVGQAQVWSPKSVDRQPAFAVASYAMLLLAAMNVFGFDAVEGLPPIPKWQHGCPRHRVTTQQLVQQLRQEVWGHAIDQIATPDECDDFVTPEEADTKFPQPILAPLPPLAYARSG